MRVIAWNVWWRFGGNWRAREESILATLTAYRPDIVGLVESWAGDGTDQARRLGAGLDRHAAWIPASSPPAERDDFPGVTLGLGLLSRWPIRTVRACDLPNEQRGGPTPSALLATVDHPRGPLHVVVAGTEWETRFAADHLAQCRALAALATGLALDGPLPVLLIGDFNAAPGHAELEPLLDAMVDTWVAGHGDPAAVTLDSSLPYAPRDAVKQLDRRIDHVFARPGRPGQPVVVRGAFVAGDRPVDGVFPSDHYAVGADLEP